MLKYKQHQENEVIADVVQEEEGFPIAFIQTVVSNVLLYLSENPKDGTKSLLNSLHYFWYVACELNKGTTQKEIGLSEIRDELENLTREYWNMGGVFMDNEQFEYTHKTITIDEPGQPEPNINTNEDPEQGAFPDIVDDMYSKRIENALDLIELNKDDTELRKISKEIGSLISILVDHGNYIHSLIKIHNQPEGS